MSSPHTSIDRIENRPERIQGRALPAILVVVTVFAVAACDTPGVKLVDPDVFNPDPDKGTTIQVQLEDSALAEALGWSQGVPNAEVQLHRIIDPFNPDTLFTDSAGNVNLAEVFPGLYMIAALRVLDSGEAAAVGGVVRAYGDGLKRNLPAGIVQLALRASQRGSLVISELYPQYSYDPDYWWAQFVELYNNSDTTVFLDGMLWGDGFGSYSSNLLPCSELEPFREDRLGIWVRELHQFPGSGRDYPVRPGQVVTIALDAIDHSASYPQFPDLTAADFELEGTSDVDNPDVPNMPSVGLWHDPRGHGMYHGEGGGPFFLAAPVDPQSLATAQDWQGKRWARVPAEKLVDVIKMHRASTTSAPQGLPQYYCDNWVYPVFERLGGGHFISYEHPRMSMHRRVLRTRPGGDPVLQDVNTSFVDFLRGSISPGRIEY